MRLESFIFVGVDHAKAVRKNRTADGIETDQNVKILLQRELLSMILPVHNPAVDLP